MAAALRPVYTAASAEAAAAALEAFAREPCGRPVSDGGRVVAPRVGPTDAATTKLIWLALRNITAGWWKAANYWHLAMSQFAILYEDRFYEGDYA